MANPFVSRWRKSTGRLR